MAGEERAAMAEQTAELSGGGGGEGGEVEDRLVMYKMKLVQFLGRTTPIILQNDNGPCPLLAICNVLLLRNVIQLNPDASGVSQEHLLQLVAARLLDSNTDVKSQDEAYQKNQQQNISDALEVLKRLPTGIDVNVLFRKINDFEFTSECAIFDLLDIGLCHGWIVDPEDKDTARAIGSKSYNALVGELVALETQYPGDDPTLPEDDTVDFAAATTATLGVPSPSLSRGLSFDDPSVVVPSESVGRKGDLEEEEELMKALTLSRSKVSDSTPINKSQSLDVTWSSLSSDSEEGTTLETSDSLIHHSEISVCQTAENHGKSHPPDKLLPQESDISSDPKRETASSGFIVENDPDSPKNDIANHIAQPVSKQFEDSQISCKAVTDILDEKQSSPSFSSVTNNSSINPTDENQTNLSWEEQAVSPAYLENNTIPENIYGPTGDKTNGNIADGYVQDALNTDLCSTCEGRDCVNFPRAVCSSLETSEPIYEGEECILDSKLVYESREPIYEGETVLAEQADRSVPHTTVHSVDGAAGERSSGTSSISSIDAQLIRDFLKTNASQLTIYGLFCLQEGLKERELCVFFRNNHFSTMFKFEKELYLLATDQGYINQPDLVWEKLNEVNGDTVFMTGNFKEFRMDNQSDPWDQRNAMSTTADYLATLKGSTASEGSNLNSDLQLAIALQEQEFGQQPVCPEPQNSQPPSTSTHPRLITGPQVSRTPPPPRQDQKTKDKCIVM